MFASSTRTRRGKSPRSFYSFVSLPMSFSVARPMDRTFTAGNYAKLYLYRTNANVEAFGGCSASVVFGVIARAVTIDGQTI